MAVFGNDTANIDAVLTKPSWLFGGAGSDSLGGGAANDRMFGGDGQDWLYANAGNDFLDGSADNDSLNGGDGLDVLLGGAGNDSMSGDAGEDELLAGDGDNALYGGPDADFLFGGPGNDILSEDGDVSAIVAPTGPTASASIVPGNAQLTWNAATGAASYDVYRKPDGGSWVLIGSTTETNYTDTTVPSDDEYAYGVASSNGAVSSAMAQTASTLVLTAASDYDHDGLNNLAEHNAGTNPAYFDTDEDLLPDGWEVDFGLDPTDSDENSNGISDQNDDFDGDELTNLGEFNLGTDPTNTDTDGDGTTDSDEASQGSDPLDASDGGQAPASDMKAQFTLTVGDSSASESERWAIHVGDNIKHTSPGYGQVGSGNYYFKAGESYDITLEHLGTRPEFLATSPEWAYPQGATGPNYDWTASVVQAGSALRGTDKTCVL